MNTHDKNPTTFARSLRRAPTVAEEMLWRDLRGRRLHGAKFRRQVPMGRYVADFVCLDARLIVELDGPHHREPAQRRHDAERDAWFRSHGYRVLRFPNDLMLGGSGELVLQAVGMALAAPPSSDPR